MRTTLERITTEGYASTPIGLTIGDREHFAVLGNEVIDLALEDQSIHRALTHNPHPNSPGKDVTGMFIGAPRVAKDDSLSFHSGWQSYPIAMDQLKQRMPALLHDFFTMQKEMLRQVERGWEVFFDELLPATDADIVKNKLSHPDTRLNNHHIRVVRYPNALDSVDSETFSAHGDLSVVTTDIYQSDQQLHIAPVQLDTIVDTVDQSRYEHYQAVKDAAKLAETDSETEAITMLGFAAANMACIQSLNVYADLRAGYHFGAGTTHEHDSHPLFGRDRVAVVAFGHPHFLTPYTQYRTTTKEACRPEQVYEGNIKT